MKMFYIKPMAFQIQKRSKCIPTNIRQFCQDAMNKFGYHVRNAFDILKVHYNHASTCV